jgi:hypothetical protein
VTSKVEDSGLSEKSRAEGREKARGKRKEERGKRKG